MESITVHNVDTNEEIIYSGLSPSEAVRNAYAQYGKRDFNTADYDIKYPLSKVATRVHGSKTVYALGQFCAVA